MEHYEIEVCGVRRQLPYIPIKKDLAFASFVIISDTELISACGKELADRIGSVDALVTAEAKGIALAYEVSRQMGLKEFSACTWTGWRRTRFGARISVSWTMSSPPASPCERWRR